MRTCIYVDGESHYVRSEACWKERHGSAAELSEILHHERNVGGSGRYPDRSPPYIRLEPPAKFFWDTCYQHLIRTPPFFNEDVHRAAYFTSVTGDDNRLHEMRVLIRRHGFDPIVSREVRARADQRANTRTSLNLIEKPKGVDIGLAVRLLEDAYRGVFELCYLFTSDADFVPAIRAIQALGRLVIVFGYEDALGSNSELEFVPDDFIDLKDHMARYGRAFPASSI